MAKTRFTLIEQMPRNQLTSKLGNANFHSLQKSEPGVRFNVEKETLIFHTQEKNPN